MENLLLSIENQTDLQIFLNLAKRLKIKNKVLSDDEILDAGLLVAMEEGQKSEFMSKDELMKKLKRYEN